MSQTARAVAGASRWRAPAPTALRAVQAGVIDASHPVSVFIADQHPVMIAGLRSVFHEDAGFLVVGSAATTDDASSVLTRELIPVCIAEDLLPGGGAGRLCRLIRDLGRPTRIVVTSSSASAGDAARAFAAGAAAFISRASSPHRFLDAVTAAATGARYADPTVAFDVLASQQGPRRRSAFGLTRAEAAVLAHLPLGRTNREIGNALNISENTVKTHLASVMRKLGAHDRAEVAAFAVRNEIG